MPVAVFKDFRWSNIRTSHISYYMSMRSWPILYCYLLQKIGQVGQTEKHTKWRTYLKYWVTDWESGGKQVQKANFRFSKFPCRYSRKVVIEPFPAEREISFWYSPSQGRIKDLYGGVSAIQSFNHSTFHEANWTISSRNKPFIFVVQKAKMFEVFKIKYKA